MNKKYLLLFVFTFCLISEGHGQLTIVNENFSTCNGVLPAGWQQYSVTGSDSWKCTISGFTDKGVYTNGYSGGGNNANEDWLISPSLDFSSYVMPQLFFQSRTKFNGNAVQLLVSNNYAGNGNPNTATWTQLNPTLPAMNSDIWTLSEYTDLSPFKNQPFYLAYKYTSTVNAASLWRVDDMNVYETALTLNKKFVNAGDCAAGAFSTGNSFVFTMNGLNGNLQLNAPAPFQISKDNVSFGTQLIYNTAAAGIPQTVYVRIAPIMPDKVFRDSIYFTYNGKPVKESQYVLGTSMPDHQTLRVANWNMRWFGHPAMCNCDTALARMHAATILKDLHADIYALQEVVNIQQLSAITHTLGPAYDYVVSPYCSGVTQVSDPYYADCQKLAYIYNTDKIQNMGTFGLLSSTYPADTSAYYCFGTGRFPFMMKAILLLSNGGSDTVIFANLHGKAYGGQEDYDRRQCGAQKMTDSLHTLFPGQKILVTGDFNDLLEGSTVPGNANSPYKYMLDNGFNGISLPSLYPGQSSYVWSTDFIIDNTVVNPGMFNKFVDSSFFIFTEALKYINDFGNSSSDHYPCMSYYKFNFPNTVSDEVSTGNELLFQIQNPTSGELKIFTNPMTNERVQLRIFELSGKLIYSDQISITNVVTSIRMPVLTKGMYFAELKSGGKRGIQKWIVE